MRSDEVMSTSKLTDKAARRQSIEDVLVRVIAGGETHLAATFIHPEFVNHEAGSERSHGPEGFARTSAWLRSCFGTISWDVHHVVVDGDMAAAHVTNAQAVCDPARSCVPVRRGRSRSGALGGPRRRRADDAGGPPRG